MNAIGRYPIVAKGVKPSKRLALPTKLMTVYQRTDGSFFVISPNKCRLNVTAIYPKGLKGGMAYFQVTDWATPVGEMQDEYYIIREKFDGCFGRYVIDWQVFAGLDNGGHMTWSREDDGMLVFTDTKIGERFMRKGMWRGWIYRMVKL